jgi:hypothetical protein
MEEVMQARRRLQSRGRPEVGRLAVDVLESDGHDVVEAATEFFTARLAFEPI